MITTKDLELVRHVAESGSLTAAARQMHVSQSAVSQRLASLRDRLDMPLFERKSGALRLTPVGTRVYEAAKVVGDELRSTMRDIQRLAGQRQERLRIATQCYTCYRWLPFVIAGLRREHPSLEVDVVPEATDDPYAALGEDRIDLAIVSNPLPGYGFDERDLFSDELFAVMSTRHPLAKRKVLTPERIAEQTLILYTGNRHAIVDLVLAPAGVQPRRITQVRITEAIIELARSGHGLAVIAGWALDDLGDTDGLSAVRITRKGFRRTWRAVVGPHCEAAYVSSLVRLVREIGKTMRNSDWRSRLREGLEYES